jgi:hypothetical protein
MATIKSPTFIDRVIGVAKFDVATFEEIEHDVSSTVWAAIVVILVGMSMGIRSMISLGTVDAFDFSVGGVVIAIGFSMVASFSLLVFTTGAYLVGGQLFRTEATSVNWPELFRVLGFAGVPLLIAPWLSLIYWALVVIPLIWFAVLVVLGIRQALDFDTTRAIITASISLLFLMVVQLIAFFLFSIVLYVAR